MNYLQFLEHIARKSGEIIKSDFKLGMKKQMKSDFSPVTITDTKINTLVIEELKKYFPTHNLKGEEESNMINETDYLWVCDPIDGTIPFSCGFPISTFSLALVYKGEPIAGVLYDPYMDRLLIGEKGKGTYLNGVKVHVNDKSKIDGNTIISGEFFSTAKYDFSDLIKVLSLKGIKYFQFCSVLYGGIMLCAGETDGVLFPHTTSHDGASLKILVQEAGGKMTDIFGNEQRYDRDIQGYIASNGKIHDELVSIIQQDIKERI
ncbi:MAG: inositol monophosphatase [Candidatus Gracilibacteria bacterium]|nr:inositol monophosphatase [Candidatus Gracilibacteria bacterium]